MDKKTKHVPPPQTRLEFDIWDVSCAFPHIDIAI